MPGRIFISCGQDSDAERKAASEVKKLLERKGFDPYVAIEAQSINDISEEVIERLKKTDFYIFIDFRREKIGENTVGEPEYRGSLFANQELAVVYYLGIEKCVFLQQKGVRLEGIGRYTLSNSRPFDDPDSVASIIDEEISRRKWSPSYSRHLVADGVEPVEGIIDFGDVGGNRLERVWRTTVGNCRTDRAALYTIAKLAHIIDSSDGSRREILSNPLKWEGRPVGYSREILPRETARFDAFAISTKDPSLVFLHSNIELPSKPIISTPGKYELHYKVFSADFPVLEFKIRLNLSPDMGDITAEVFESL